MKDEINYYNPNRRTDVTHNRIPHWEQAKASYFITFRLADSIPPEALSRYMEQKRRWLEKAPGRPWPEELELKYRKHFTGRFELWLDRGHGSCILGQRDNAHIVRESLEYHDGERYSLHAWVIMPNHVHILTSLHGTNTLSKVLHTWKGYSARQINKRMNQSGAIWQKSYFDRSVRDQDHFIQCARYIRNNPKKARIPHSQYVLHESEAVRLMLA